MHAYTQTDTHIKVAVLLTVVAVDWQVDNTGSTHLFRNRDLWTQSWLPLTADETLKWLSLLPILLQNNPGGDSVALSIVPPPTPPHPRSPPVPLWRQHSKNKGSEVNSDWAGRNKYAVATHLHITYMQAEHRWWTSGTEVQGQTWPDSWTLPCLRHQSPHPGAPAASKGALKHTHNGAVSRKRTATTFRGQKMYPN